MMDENGSRNWTDRLGRIGNPRKGIAALPKHNGRCGGSAERLATGRPAEASDSGVPDIGVVLLVHKGGRNEKNKIGKHYDRKNKQAHIKR